MVLLAALAVLLVWKAILPGWQTLNTDFPNYYTVARLLREGYSLDRIYEWIWLQRIHDHWGMGNEALMGFAGLTPFSAWPVLPLTFFKALTAKRIWIVLNLIFLGVSVELLHRCTALGRRRVWIIALLAIVPLRTSFLYGQMHIVVLLLLALAYFFLERRRSIGCGVCVALAGALKIYPLLFLLYFGWKRQYRVVLSMLVCGCAVIAAGLVTFGPHVLHLYVVQVLPSTVRAESIDPYNIRAASAVSLLHLLFLYEPGLNPHPVFASTNAYAIVYPLFQLLVFLPLFTLIRPGSSAAREKLEWTAFLLALLVASPVPSSYHFVVMIPCIALLVDVLAGEGDLKAIFMALILYVLISPASSDISPGLPRVVFILLSTSRLWLGLVLLGLILTRLARQRPASVMPQARLALLTGVSAVVLIASMLSWQRHLNSVSELMGGRVKLPQPTLLAIDAVPLSGNGYMYTAMTPRGYRTVDRSGEVVDAEPGDQYSFALAPSGDVFVESAGATGSNIVRIAHGLPPHIVLRDAESPAISPDGHTIAFLRERKGRGSVWTAQLRGDSASDPVRAVPDTYDVRTVKFLPSGALLFTASTADSRLGLYAIAAGGVPQRLSAAGEEIGAAAAAPFTHLLAITRLEDNRWQLAYLDPESGHETLLTHQDCNAYSPAWMSADTILYSTDCARGYGLTALAAVKIGNP